jgi:hypothetical protein
VASIQFHGQMARVPLTARQKFNEAALLQRDVGTPYEHCHISVLPERIFECISKRHFFLQKQYSNSLAFKAWYAEKVAVVIAGPVLVMLAKKRTAVVHLAPIDLFFTQSFQMPARYSGVTRTRQFELVQDQVPGRQFKTGAPPMAWFHRHMSGYRVPSQATPTTLTTQFASFAQKRIKGS